MHKQEQKKRKKEEENTRPLGENTSRKVFFKVLQEPLLFLDLPRPMTLVFVQLYSNQLRSLSWKDGANCCKVSLICCYFCSWNDASEKTTRDPFSISPNCSDTVQLITMVQLISSNVPFPRETGAGNKLHRSSQKCESAQVGRRLTNSSVH